MNPIVSILLTNCRSNAYLFIGICLGLSISLLFLPIDLSSCSENLDSGSNPHYLIHCANSVKNNFRVNEFERKISSLASEQLKIPQPPNVFVRPRYYSTELGIRNKLFVGVLTSPEYLYSRAVTMNRSLAHLVDKVRYFVSIAEGTKPNVSLPGIVGFTDARVILQPFHALKYITDSYLEDYDYYFLVKDVSFVNARRLSDLIYTISVSQDVYLGVASNDEKYCSLDGGILLSNSMIRRMKDNLDHCVKITYSSSDDVNFGRCVLHSTLIPCTNTAQGQSFSSTKLNTTFDYQNNFKELIAQENFKNSVTVFPIFDHLLIYKLNKYFAEMELLDVGRKIGGLHAEISRTANFTADIDLTWPIGSQPKFKTANRFDVLKWTYFNMTHSFYDDDFGVVEEFSSGEKNEVEEIINTTVTTFLKNSEQKLVFTNLENGYWKLDNARGVDYLLDLSFLTNEEREISIRIQACQPVGKVEILPVPYVTENSRINMVIIVDFRRITEAIRFLAHYANVCMDRKDKTSLTIILLYNPGHVSKGSNDIFYTVKQRVLYLTHKYKKDQLKVTWFSIRLPTVTNFVETESSLKIAIADLYINKLTSDNLILLADSRMEIKVEFLNRVRMNTINQWQVFSPIPFVQYNPSIIQYGEKNHVMFDIVHSNGRFDEYNYDFVSFYARDYATVRKSIKNQIPLVQTDKDIASMLKLSQGVPINSIFDMFAVHGKLNTFRATEPALKLFYRDVSCNGTKNNLSQSMCLKRKSLQLGNRGQLARLILNYQEQYH